MKNLVVMNKRYDFDLLFEIIVLPVFCAMLIFMCLVISEIFFTIVSVLFCVIFILILPLSIKRLTTLYRLPKCKAVEIVDNNLLIYGYNRDEGSYVKHKIDLQNIDEYQISRVGRSRRYNYNYGYMYMDIFTTTGNFVLKELNRKTKKPKISINYDILKIKQILNRAFAENCILQSKLPDKTQNRYATAMFKNYLANTLGAAPLAVRYVVHWFRYDNKRFYIIKFKRNTKDKRYLLGVNGGYNDSKTRANGFSLTEFKSYNKKTAIKDAKKLVEKYYSKI